MKKSALSVLLLAALLIAPLSPAWALGPYGYGDSVKIGGEIAPGFVDVNGDSAFAISASGLYLFAGEANGEKTPMLRYGIRPEFTYQRFGKSDGSANEIFFAVSGQAEFTNLSFLAKVPEMFVPFAFAGGGWERLGSSVSAGKSSSNGGFIQLGAGVKVFFLLNLYAAPTFTFVRGFGEVEANQYRFALGLGGAF